MHPPPRGAVPSKETDAVATIELGGKMLEVDEDGFISDPSQWDEKAL